MSYQGSTALRHSPKQARGQRKVDHILRVAEALFAEVGFENATTNAVAARAGISIGSLYQFFSGKEAILEAMADRYLEQTRAALRKHFTTTLDLDTEPFMRILIDAMLKQQEQRPYFLQALATSRPSRALAERVELLLDEYAELMVNRWRERGVGGSDKGLLKLRAKVTVRVLTGLLPLALSSRGKERVAVMDEIHQVVVNYVKPTLKKPGEV